MWPDWVSNPGPLTYESGALPTALQGPAILRSYYTIKIILMCKIPNYPKNYLLLCMYQKAFKIFNFEHRTTSIFLATRSSFVVGIGYGLTVRVTVL